MKEEHGSIHEFNIELSGVSPYPQWCERTPMSRGSRLNRSSLTQDYGER